MVIVAVPSISGLNTIYVISLSIYPLTSGDGDTQKHLKCREFRHGVRLESFTHMPLISYIVLGRGDGNEYPRIRVHITEESKRR